MSDFTCFEYFARVLDRIEPDEDRKAMAIALIYYGTRGEEPDLPSYLLPTFEALRESIDNSVNARVNNKGGRHRKKKPSNEAENAEQIADDKETGVSQEKTGVSNSGTPVTENENLNLSDPNLTEPNQSKPKKERFRFVPPTVEEVRDYCAEKGYAINPEHFVDFYESKGWMVGRNKMKDWKASVRTWVKRREEEREKDGKKVPTSDFSEYDD